MEELPSVLEVEVCDFNGPLDQGASLGHAEIHFLNHTADELADLNIPLSGHHAQASQSTLQLRIFLETKTGVETLKDSLSKVEKEVGKKVNKCIYCNVVSIIGPSLRRPCMTVEHSVTTEELRFPETVGFAS